MKCLLFASWKPYTTHTLAGYIHQITGRHRVVVWAHLDFTSRSSIEQSVIRICRAATSLVSMTHCLYMLGDHWSRRHDLCSLMHFSILQRWARYLGPCETGLHIFADTSNAQSYRSLHMHAWVSHASADTHGCPLHQDPLDFPPGFFQVYTNFATRTPATWASGLRSLPFISAQLSQAGSLF